MSTRDRSTNSMTTTQRRPRTRSTRPRHTHHDKDDADASTGDSDQRTTVRLAGLLRPYDGGDNTRATGGRRSNDGRGKAISSAKTRRNLDYICLGKEMAAHQEGPHGYVRTLTVPSYHSLVCQDIMFREPARRMAAAVTRGPDADRLAVAQQDGSIRAHHNGHGRLATRPYDRRRQPPTRDGYAPWQAHDARETRRRSFRIQTLRGTPAMPKQHRRRARNNLETACCGNDDTDIEQSSNATGTPMCCVTCVRRQGKTGHAKCDDGHDDTTTPRRKGDKVVTRHRQARNRVMQIMIRRTFGDGRTRVGARTPTRLLIQPRVCTLEVGGRDDHSGHGPRGIEMMPSALHVRRRRRSRRGTGSGLQHGCPDLHCLREVGEPAPCKRTCHPHANERAHAHTHTPCAGCALREAVGSGRRERNFEIQGRRTLADTKTIRRQRRRRRRRRQRPREGTKSTLR